MSDSARRLSNWLEIFVRDNGPDYARRFCDGRIDQFASDNEPPGGWPDGPATRITVGDQVLFDGRRYVVGVCRLMAGSVYLKLMLGRSASPGLRLADGWVRDHQVKRLTPEDLRDRVELAGAKGTTDERNGRASR